MIARVAGKFLFLLGCFSIQLCCITADAASEYHAQSSDPIAVVIDAGSTGSRLHVFQYHDNGANALPNVRELAPSDASVKPGLASYASHPQDAGPALKPLLDKAQEIIIKAGGEISAVEFDLLSTAGMRLLPATTQKQIYDAVDAYVTTYFYFKTKQLVTISGQMEGFYGWLSVNYWNNALQSADNKQLPNIRTNGALDLGGASTQVTFSSGIPAASVVASLKQDFLNFKLAGKHYTVFAHSFLGLGLDQARTKIANLNCYPSGYVVPNLGVGNFNGVLCQSAVSKFIKQAAVAQIVPVLPDNKHYIAFSGYFYVMNFFKAENIAVLDSKIQQICQQNSWQQLQKLYPNEKPEYLANYCFGGVYVGTLLTEGYRFSPTTDTLQFTSKVGDHNIDWSLGFVVAKFADYSVQESK